MAAVDLGESKKGAGGPSWKRPRVKIRIDMTPMVDIAFLLLIFFMVTTVFRLPQTMEMALPENDPDNPPPTVKVADTDLLTVYVMRLADHDSLAYRIGNGTPHALAWKALGDTLVERREISGYTEPSPGDTTGMKKLKLTVLAKIDKKATYESLVNLVDQFNVDSINRFSIDKYTTLDDSLLRVAGFATQGPAGLPEPALTSDDSQD
jgi:biopolymer transport protein ExbD